ncbi:MAG: MBL fold metallo-hydrolase [Dehalococcoidales bacterium]|nr:MBL fold metallo-hydrolase [Dehalococcoidales bacterium]
MNEIRPGIHRMQIPIPNNPLGHTNVYLVRGNDGYLLIDAGWDSDEALAAMGNQLEEIGLTFSDITRILVTHVHGDHYGLVYYLKQHTDAEVIVHRIEKDILLERHVPSHNPMEDIEGIFQSNGAPAGEIPMPKHPERPYNTREPVVPDTTVEDGEIISTGEFELQIIWTPGHSAGHICIYEPENKLLFGGDHVLPVITPNISLLPNGGDNPLGNFLQSMETLDLLDVDLVLPAHEEIYPDLHKRIREIKQHHRNRNLEIQETLKTGPKTAYQVSSYITWVPEAGGIRYKDLHPMDKRMAVLETLAHLRAMVVDEEITSYEEDGTTYYRIS